MRKVYASILALVLCFSFSGTLSNVCMAAEYDLSGLTSEELIQLRNDIDARLVPVEPDFVIYDNDEIYVSWFGIEDTVDTQGEHAYQLDYLISNQTDHNLYYYIDNIAINGFLISTSNEIKKDLPAHTSVYTAATNANFFDKEILDSTRFSGTFETVSARIRFYQPDENGDFSYNDPFLTLNPVISI